MGRVGLWALGGFHWLSPPQCTPPLAQHSMRDLYQKRPTQSRRCFAVRSRFSTGVKDKDKAGESGRVAMVFFSSSVYVMSCSVRGKEQADSVEVFWEFCDLPCVSVMQRRWKLFQADKLVW